MPVVQTVLTYSCLDRLLLELLVERPDELWHFLLEQVQGTARVTRKAVFYNGERGNECVIKTYCLHSFACYIRTQSVPACSQTYFRTV
jgi:hypothetical protein